MQILLLLSFLTLRFSEAELPFLTISPGARAVSMGSAFVALADDATASYYNPAGLAFQRKTSIVSMNSVFLPGLPQVIYHRISCKDFPRGSFWLPGLCPGMRHFYLGVTVSISEKESFGFGYTYLNTGKTTATDKYGNEIAEFETYDYAAIISYGRNVYRGLGIGFSFKYIESFLCPEWVVKDVLGLEGGTATATAYDWGILYQFTDTGLSFGISCQNLGSEGVQYLSTATSAPMPALCRIGTCYNCVHFDKALSSFGISSLMFTMDRINDLVGEVHDTWWSGGSEVTFQDLLSVRFGYFYDKDGQRTGSTVGCGIKLGSLKLDIASDENIYAFSTDNSRVQISLQPLSTTETNLFKKRELTNITYAGISSLVFPGAGQFYNGDVLKGFIFSLGTVCLAEICYDVSEGNRWSTPEITLGVIHLVSLADAIYTAASKTDQ